MNDVLSCSRVVLAMALVVAEACLPSSSSSSVGGLVCSGVAMAEDSVVRSLAVAALDHALSRPIPMGGLEDALAAFRRRGG